LDLIAVLQRQRTDHAHVIHVRSVLAAQILDRRLPGNLILIDHSRAFPTNPELPRKMPRVDGPLWGAIQSLTRAQLGDVLRAWLADDEIDAIIQRRERMKAELSTVSR